LFSTLSHNKNLRDLVRADSLVVNIGVTARNCALLQESAGTLFNMLGNLVIPRFNKADCVFN
jgi:hypothetical protein